jgi:hypothetical protein
MTSALIIETGLGVPNANSYTSAAEATTYLQNYESNIFDSWPTDTAAQEAALLTGCQAVEYQFRDRYLSSRRIPVANELCWPRFPFYDRNGVLILDRTIPIYLKQAQACFALYYIMGMDLYPQQPKESALTSESLKIGDLSTSVGYSRGTNYDPFRKVTMMMWTIIRNDHATNIIR